MFRIAILLTGLFALAAPAAFAAGDGCDNSDKDNGPSGPQRPASGFVTSTKVFYRLNEDGTEYREVGRLGIGTTHHPPLACGWAFHSKSYSRMTGCASLMFDGAYWPPPQLSNPFAGSNKAPETYDAEGGISLFRIGAVKVELLPDKYEIEHIEWSTEWKPPPPCRNCTPPRPKAPPPPPPPPPPDGNDDGGEAGE